MGSIIKVRQSGRKHRLRTTSILSVIVILLVGGGWLYYNRAKTDSAVEAQKQTDTLIADAKSLKDSGKKDEAQRKLQQVIDSASSPDQKNTAYLYKAELLTGNAQLDALIEAYKQVPSSQAAAYIAQRADEYKNKDVAIEYYQKAIETKNEFSYEAAIEAYQERIAELKK